MRKGKLRAFIQGGIFIAIALILEYLTLFIPKMPNGGKFISLGMIPLIIFALTQDWKWGTLVGMIFGVLYFILIDRCFFHPCQFILDYLIAFGSIGIAGFFYKAQEENFNNSLIYLVIVLICTLRFLSHFFSGVIFIDLIVPGIKNPWLYSMIYNAVYMIPTTLVCLLILPLIIKKIKPFLFK